MYNTKKMAAEAITNAVKTGTLEEVKKAIEDGGVTEALKLIMELKQVPSSYGTAQFTSQMESLLHLACRYNIKRPEVAFYLMDTFGLHMNMTGFEGATPLMYACKSGMVKVVQRFLEKESDFRFHDNNYFGLLHYCFMGGFPALPREELIKLGYQSAEQEEEDKMEIVNLLFSKIPKDHYNVKLLLSNEYEMSMKHGYGKKTLLSTRTVLDLIILNKYEQCLPLLITKGAKYIHDPCTQIIKNEISGYLKQRRFNLRTFVHWCTETRKEADFISHLLKQFNGNIIDDQDEEGKTPVFYVTNDLYDILLSEPICTLSKTEKANFEAEIQKYIVEITKFLLENGANVNAMSHRKKTPLVSYCFKNMSKQTTWSYPIIECLLSKGAKIYNQTQLEFTGLVHQLISESSLNGVCSDAMSSRQVSPTSENQDQEVMKTFKETMTWYISELRIDVDERSEHGRTGLHYCCLPRDPYYQTRHKMSYNTQHIIQYLVEEFSADIDAQDNLGYTALMYAVKYEMFQQTAMLMKLGADSYIEGNDGMTAVSLAHGCSEKTELFLSTVRKSGATSPENNLIVQCQGYISQVCRLLRKQENMVSPEKKERVICSLKDAENNLDIIAKDPEVNLKLKIQNEVLRDYREKICQTVSPEYIYDHLRQER